MKERFEIAKIVAGCKRGDDDSFSRLVDMYGSRCYGYFYRMTGSRDLSDDLLSELFVRLVEKIRTFRGVSFNGWLFKVTRSIFYDYLRRKIREERTAEGHKKQIEEDLKRERKDGDETTDRLQKKLFQLDEETRDVIMLRFYSELSFKEIAEIYGEPIGTVLSRVHRGLKRLREMME